MRPLLKLAALPAGGRDWWRVFRVEFALGENTRVRPDVAVILHDRWREVDHDAVPIEVAPQIAVEVISDSELSGESARKVWTYLQRGVQEVWQVFPADRMVVAYTANSRLRFLEERDVLESELLPGWNITVSEAFKF